MFKKRMKLIAGIVLYSFSCISQNLYPIDNFPVWDMPNQAFSEYDYLYGPNLNTDVLSGDIYNIRLKFRVSVKRIEGITQTPNGSTFSGKIILPFWFILEQDNSNSLYLNPDYKITPQTDSIINICGLVDANWSYADYEGQTSLDEAIITESDYLLMYQTADIGQVAESEFDVVIQSPIIESYFPTGIYLMNDYSGNWSSNLNSGNWFGVLDGNGVVNSASDYNGYDVNVYYDNISVEKAVDEVSSAINGLYSIVDTTICTNQGLVIQNPLINSETFLSQSWYFNDQYVSNEQYIEIYDPGLYRLEVFGCDTLYKEFVVSTIDYDFNPLYDKYICEGDSIDVFLPDGNFENVDSFYWSFEGVLLSYDSTIVISEPGEYTLQLFGCDTSNLTFDLSYFELISDIGLSDSIIFCEGNNNVIETPYYLDNGYTSYNWYYNDLTAPSLFGSLLAESTGMYTLEMYGCDTILDSIYVEIIPNTPINLNLEDAIICSNGSITYSIIEDMQLNTHEFQWFYNDNLYSFDSTITVNEQGTYRLELYGCPNISEEFNVSYYNTVLPEFNDTIICVGEDVVINFPNIDISENFDFSWQLNGFDYSYDSTLVAYQAGVFSLIISSCSQTYTETFEISFHDVYLQDFTIEDTVICEGDVVYYTLPENIPNSYSNFQWFFNGIEYSLDSVISIDFAASFSLALYGCDTIIESFEVSVLGLEDVNFAFNDTSICEGDSIYIQFPEGDFSGYSEFYWLFNDEVLSVDSNLLLSDAGVYSLQFLGCPYQAEYFNLSFYDYPLLMSDSELNVNEDIFICIEDDPVLITPYNDYPHTWYLNGSALDSSYNTRDLVLESIFTDLDLNTLYNYSVEIDFGCGLVSANNEVSIAIIECECALEMPNIFTPNADNNNDVFMPLNNYNSEVENPLDICRSTMYKLEIFNQWGRHIKTVLSNDEYPSWDGKNKNDNEMREGVYFYNVQYQINIYNDPENREQTGFFHLIR